MGKKIGIVVSEFNYDVTYMMAKKAKEHANLLGLEVKWLIKTPGVYDVPLVVKKLLSNKEVDGLAVIGAVIKGETKHDELIINQTARKIMDLSVEYGKPVTLGIIGPGATHEHAIERIDEYSSRSIESLAKLLAKVEKLENGIPIIED